MKVAAVDQRMAIRGWSEDVSSGSSVKSTARDVKHARVELECWMWNSGLIPLV